MPMRGFRHVGLKAMSIGLAALLWLLVSGEQLVERALRIPLEFTNIPGDLELMGEPPTVVDARVRGSSGALGRIGAGELVAVLDLANARPGRGLFHLTVENVRAPFGVDVVQVAPSSVSMRFERSQSKFVPVLPQFDGDPAPGFVVGTVTSDPSTVEVVGAASALQLVTEAITSPVSVTGRAVSFVETVTVGSPDPAVRLRTRRDARVSVTITAAPIEWSVANVTVQIRNAARPTEVTPKVVTVFARGPRDSGGVTASDFDASVDVDGLRSGQFELPIRVVPPATVGIVRVEPDRVGVRVR
jgi:YbbR domain-containing protein